jgi:hypothetical protein
MLKGYVSLSLSSASARQQRWYQGAMKAPFTFGQATFYLIANGALEFKGQFYYGSICSFLDQKNRAPSKGWVEFFFILTRWLCKRLREPIRRTNACTLNQTVVHISNQRPISPHLLHLWCFVLTPTSIFCYKPLVLAH